MRSFLNIVIAVVVGTGTLAAADDRQAFVQAIEAARATLEHTGELTVGERTIYGHRFVDGLYAQNNNQPLWNASNRQALFSALDSLQGDGLDPADYIFPEVADYLPPERQSALTAAERLELDILLTEGLIRALYNLAFGRVDPVALDGNFNFARKLENTDITTQLIDSAVTGQVDTLLDSVRPQRPSYAALKQGLQRYRDIQTNGGWQPVPDGKALKPGDTGDDRIPLIAERLAITGDYSMPPGESEDLAYDEALVEAVERFQARHNLGADGILGAKTLAAMNVPVDQRIDQIRVNLERLRWYLHALEDEFILVNIAGFNVLWVKDDAIEWEQIAQVGKEFTQTPVFKDEIEYLDFNPTWTIPPGILNRTVIPNLKKDPGYLDKKGYELLTLQGQPVDPSTVDWQNLEGFPYMVRQPPGPNNALGLVKFMFPNPHLVFLHDTNARHLFDRPRRLFSSGCIRVKEPFDLAERLLRDKDGWNRARIDEVVASGKTTRVRLDEPMPIIIGYATAVARDGQVVFREDIYDRDQGVLDALNAEFRIRNQDSSR
jgi:murein L,D-transpeptidase YcbB/YkuD